MSDDEGAWALGMGAVLLQLPAYDPAVVRRYHGDVGVRALQPTAQAMLDALPRLVRITGGGRRWTAYVLDRAPDDPAGRLRVLARRGVRDLAVHPGWAAAAPAHKRRVSSASSPRGGSPPRVVLPPGRSAADASLVCLGHVPAAPRLVVVAAALGRAHAPLDVGDTVPPALDALVARTTPLLPLCEAVCQRESLDLFLAALGATPGA